MKELSGIKAGAETGTTIGTGLLGVEVSVPYGCDAGKLLDAARLEEIERRILAIEARLDGHA